MAVYSTMIRNQNQRWSDETFSQAQLVDLNGILSTGKSIAVIPVRQRQHIYQVDALSCNIEPPLSDFNHLPPPPRHLPLVLQ